VFVLGLVCVIVVITTIGLPLCRFCIRRQRKAENVHTNEVSYWVIYSILVTHLINFKSCNKNNNVDDNSDNDSDSDSNNDNDNDNDNDNNKMTNV